MNAEIILRLVFITRKAKSAPDAKSPRTLFISEASDIPQVEAGRKAEMLDIFAEGYFRAVEILAGRKPPKGDRPDKRPDDRPPQFPGFPDF